MTLYPDILTDEDLLPISTAALPNHLYPALPHQPQINQTFSPSASRQSSLSSSQSFGSADTRSTSAASRTQSLSAGSLNQYDQNHNPVNSRASLPINIYYEIHNKKALSKNGNAPFYQIATLENQLKKVPLPAVVTGSSENSNGFTLKLALSAVAAFLTSSLPSGFNMGVVNTPEVTFMDFFNYTLNLNRGPAVVDRSTIELLWSIAVALLLVGAFIGCTFTGHLADKIGRKGLLTLNAILGLFGVSLCWLSKFLPTLSVPVFLAGRFIAGLHTGVGSSLVPMYLIEIAPKSDKGNGIATALGVLHVIGLNGGQMVAMSLGLQSVLGSTSRWQLLFAVNGAFIVVGLLLLFFCPESPTFLFVLKKNEPKAITQLMSLRGKSSVIELVDEIQSMRHEAKSRQSSSHQLSIFTVLKNSRRFRVALLIVCALHAFQQLCGINAVFYYSTKTFRSVGLSDQTAQYSSIGCTALNTTMALVAVLLIRRFSSKALLLTSSLATSVCLLLLTLSMTFQAEWLNFATIGLILAYVLFFAIGQGPIPFMIGGELFDQSTMAIGMSIGCFVNWFCNFLIAITFPIIAMIINQYVFLIFLAFNVLLVVFVYFKVPGRVGSCSEEGFDEKSAKERTVEPIAF